MPARLVLAYRPAAEPPRCVGRRPVSAEPNPGLISRVAGAQPEAARWLAPRPDHVLARFRCEIGGKATERGV